MATLPSLVGVVARGAKEKGDKLITLAACFSAELEELGYSGAVVLLDLENDVDEKLAYVGLNGMPVEGGEMLLRRYLKMREDPMAETVYSRAVVSATGEIQ